jgi:hypothetical protein
MFGEAIQSRTPEPSFYYVMLAATCFRRTAHRSPPNACALRDIGCKYLAKAVHGVARKQISEFSLARISHRGPKASWRQPWTID